MTKVNVTFEQFSKAAWSLPATPVKQTDKIFFVKTDNAGKIELNCNSGTWTVGSGSKYPAEITAAVKAAGFAVVKENRCWTILNFVSLEQICDLASAVNSAVPAAKPKAKAKAKAKTKEIPVEKMLKDLGVAPQLVDSTDKTLEEIEAIKTSNLKKLREVTAELRAKARAEFEADEAEAAKEDPRDYVPKFLHKELGIL